MEDRYALREKEDKRKRMGHFYPFRFLWGTRFKVGGAGFKVGGAGFKCPLLVIQILFKALGLNQFGLAYHFVYLVFFPIIYNIQNSE